MRIRRITITFTLLVLLLLSWQRSLAGGPGEPPRRPPAPWRIIQTPDLRPRLLDPTTGEIVWEGPPLTHLFRRSDGTLAWVPTGTETDAYAQPLPSHLPLPTSHSPLPTPNLPLPIPHSLLPTPFSPPPTSHSPLPTSSPPSPPRFIRVRHSAYNTCRNAVPGQIDIIPFEEYVARVLPAEMPTGWPMEALKAQAIAIRTYAWYQVLKGRPDYDVSDWTDYQVMCDARYPRADAAVQATRGQAVFYNGAPILAMYSAQNGHPTRGVDWLPYLNPVPDPVSLFAQRRGHGYGLSQWGAYLWSKRGWNAYQILAHYYPNTYLALPPDATEPAGSILPLELEDMTLGRGYPLTLFAAFPQPPRALTVTAHTAEGGTTVVLTRTGNIDAWLGTWIPSRTLSSTHPITLTATVQDGQGRVWNLGEAHIWRDLRAPTITLTHPSDTVNPRFPITVVEHAPVDVMPRLGVGDDWVWEEGAFDRNPAEAGDVVTDTEALNGRALQLPPGAVAYGPYTSVLPPGRAYRAWFRLSTTATTEADTVVFLDIVADSGQTLLGLRALRGIEFSGPGKYREYPVDFYLPGAPLSPRYTPTYTLEFRTHALGASVRLDRVLVTSYPLMWGSSQTWELTKRDGEHRLIVKQTTPSGQVSGDIPLSVTLHIPHPAMTFTAPAPEGWISKPTTLLWPVTTAVAPPREGTFFGRFRRGDEDWSPWYATPVRATSSRSGIVEWDTQSWPDGKDITVELWGLDEFSYAGNQLIGPFRVDQRPPTLELHVSATPTADGWYTAPLTVTVSAQDMGIGVIAIRSDVSAQTGARVTYHTVRAEPTAGITQVIPLRTDARYTLTITASDALSHTITRTRFIALDTTPPQTRLFAPEVIHRPWVKLRWLGQDVHTVVSYDVEVRTEDGQWVTWLQNTHARWGRYRGHPGQRVSFRARAQDAAGWVGPWSAPITLRLPYTQFLPTLRK